MRKKIVKCGHSILFTALIDKTHAFCWSRRSHSHYLHHRLSSFPSSASSSLLSSSRSGSRHPEQAQAHPMRFEGSDDIDVDDQLTTATAQKHADEHGHTNAQAPLVDVYPYGTPASEILDKNKKQKRYSHCMVVHYLRHAQGEHNVNQEYRALHNLDARLTQLGEDQCRALANRIRQASSSTPDNKNNQQPTKNLSDLYQNAQLFVTSPMTRCIQTITLSMEPLLVKKEQKEAGSVVGPLVVAHEGIRETVNYNCDRRRTLDELAQEFPHVDFSPMRESNDYNNNEDALWQAYIDRLGCDVSYPFHRESAEIYKVADRARSFLEWLRQRPEHHVVICSHAAFSRCLWNFGLPGHVPLLMPQKLDDRVGGPDNVPVVKYCGPEGFAEALRADYDNCELRSMVLAFRTQY